MAKVIWMKNPQTGFVKKGFYGFSWTTLLFGGFPAFFRGDLLTGVLVIIAAVLTGGISSIIWAFMYNRYYTRKLIEQGYQFVGPPQQIQEAKMRLGIASQGV